MSGFFNDTNKGRAEKIVGTLKHIEKSARSNRATPEQVADILSPIFDQLGRMGIASAVVAADLPSREPRQADEDTETVTVPAPPCAGRRSLKDDIDEMPFHELTSIITLAALRIDAAAAELEQAEKEVKT